LGDHSVLSIDREIGVRDGDDVVLLVAKSQYRIRLAGIDAPELQQAFGSRAKQALSKLAFGKTARAEISARDRYRRRIGTVCVGDVNVNESMVANGWAWHFKRYSTDEKLAKLETEARRAKRGLWVAPDPNASRKKKPGAISPIQSSRST